MECKSSTRSTRALKQAIKVCQTGVSELEKLEVRHSDGGAKTIDTNNNDTLQSSQQQSTGERRRSCSHKPSSTGNPQQDLVDTLKRCSTLEERRSSAISRNDSAAESAADGALASHLDQAVRCCDPSHYSGTKQRDDAQAARNRFRQAADTFRSADRARKNDTVRAIRTTWKTAKTANSAAAAASALTLAAGISLVATTPTMTVMGADGQMHVLGVDQNADGTTTYMQDTDGDCLYDQQCTLDDLTGQLVEGQESMGMFDTISAAFESVSELFAG